jgi:hypothetical protein
MRTKPNWGRLFLFCLGLFIAGNFSMKWIEPDLVYQGEKISIFGLELFYPAERIMSIFSGIDDKVKTILGYHLSFDFIFMAGCFPGIACLCMIAAQKTGVPLLKKILFIMAFLQLLAWLFDIIENYLLLKWLHNPVIGDEFDFFHSVVYTKWIFALAAALCSLSVLAFSWMKRKNLKSEN